MPRDGSLTFSDLAGRLEVLNVACDKCGRRGRYHVARLVAEHGPDRKVTDWRAALLADCPKVQAASHWDACAARMPDLAGLRIS